MDRNDPSWRVTAIYSAALYSVMVYDWLISLNKEYKYIWKAKPTLVSGLYLVIRYFELIRDAFTNYLANTNLTYDECKPFTGFQVYGSMVTSFAVSLLFSLRVSALWGNNKFVLGGLVTLLVIMISINAYAGTLFGPPGPFSQGSGPCFAGPRLGTSPITVVLWLNPFIFDVLLTVMLSIGIFTIKRKGASTNSGILQVLIRDGLVYFIIISVANLINVGFYIGLANNPSYRAINSGMAYSVASVVSCRLILALREHADREASGFMSSHDNAGQMSGRKHGATRIKAALNGQNFDMANDFQVTHTHQLRKDGNNAMAHTVNIPLGKLDRKGSDRSDDGEMQRHIMPGVYIVKESHIDVDEEKGHGRM